MGRSRSPRGSRRDTEWISRAVCSFGRYPHKAPPGLRVDQDGAFSLEELVDAWGRHQNLTAQDIMTAIQAHMFHDVDDRGSGLLRFAVDSDQTGSIYIRVMPKRGSGYGGQQALATPARSRRGLGGWRASSACATPRGTPRGSVMAQMPMQQANVPPLPTATKLTMSLDEVIRDERVVVDRAPAAPLRSQAPMMAPMLRNPDSQAQRERIYHKLGQMGLTSATKDLRQAPRPRAREGRYFSEGAANGAGQRRGAPAAGARAMDDKSSAGYKVQKWIAWVLKAGHRELGIAVDAQGWAGVAEIAAAIGRSGRRFGEFDAPKLTAFLADTDQAGRFEVVGGRLRKVPREESARHAVHGSVGSVGAGDARDVSPARSSASSQCRMRSRSGSPAYDDKEEDQALADACRKGLQVASSTVDLAMDDDGDEALELHAAKAELFEDGGAGANGVPARPPGRHWTKYQDDGDHWWYYEGPLGKWWCPNPPEEPQRYDDAED